MLRPIIEIDEDKCNGCGQCILDCAEGALAIVNGKAKLISDVYCDGLGACLNCPQGALKLATREAPPFDEEAALAAKQKREAGGEDHCAGARPKILQPLRALHSPKEMPPTLHASLPAWPIQLALAPGNAAFFQNANLLLCAHCSGFALPNFHKDWLPGRMPLIACPKLEDNAMLADRLGAILELNQIKSLTILRMSVPCCAGLLRVAERALEKINYQPKLETHIVQL